LRISGQEEQTTEVGILTGSIMIWDWCIWRVGWIVFFVLGVVLGSIGIERGNRALDRKM